MSSAPPPEPPSGGRSFAEENAMRIAAESLTHYDPTSDTYHCSYGPPVPALTVRDPERGLLVRVEPRSRQVVGFSIPDFRTWYTAHAEPDGSFEVELPPTWPLGPGEAPGAEGVEDEDEPLG